MSRPSPSARQRRALLLALPVGLLSSGCASLGRTAAPAPGPAPAVTAFPPPAVPAPVPAGGNRPAPATAGTAARPIPPTAQAAPAATPVRQVVSRNWAGRLSLRIDADPPQAFHAGFELKGNPTAGDLALFSPLGSTLMQISWTPNDAVWRGNNQVQHYSSLDSLVTHALGAPIPVRTLFDWLQGGNTTAPGWRTDLSRLADGRLVVQRFDPAPEVELRLVVDR